MCIAFFAQQTFLVWADTTINASPANTGTYSLTDGGLITVNANITQTNGDGSGGTVTLNAGTIITVNSGRTIDVSATTAGKAGGTINLSAPAILINGSLKANGNGSGRGGTINLTGTGAGGGSKYIDIGGSGVLEAKGGNSGGLGGVINIIGGTDTDVNVADNARIETTGVTASGANEIYITGDGTSNGALAVYVEGDIYANGPSGTSSTGGLIRFTTYDGKIQVHRDAHIDGRALGTGTGGTLDFLLSNGSGAFTFNNLLDIASSSDIRMDGNSTVNNGIVRFGRPNAGTMTLDWDDVNRKEIDGIGTCYVGNFANSNVSSITTQDYDVDSDMNNGAGGIALNFNATGAITGTNNMDYSTVSATSTSGGAISITDDDNDLTVDGISTTGTATLNADSGNLTVKNASLTNTTTLQAKANITASDTTNTFSGNVLAYGDSGSGDAASAVSIRSTGDLTVTSLNSSSATLNAAGDDLTVSGATVSGASTLTAADDITASATTNNFGTTVAATGNDISIYDNSGTLTLNGVTATGNMTAQTAAGGSISLTSVDATGTTNVTAGGGTSDITGSTGNVFRGAANFTTASVTSGSTISLTGDFQGNTTFYAHQIQAVDSAGNFTVTALSTGESSNSNTLTANSANANVDVTIDDLSVGGENAKLTITADKNITVRGGTWYGSNNMTGATIVANSNSGGNFTLSGFRTSTNFTGATSSQTGPSSGIWVGTNGGTHTFTNSYLGNSTTVTATNDISGTGNTFVGSTSFNAGASKDITFSTSDFQNATNAFTGDDVSVNDNVGALTISSVTATNLTAAASQNTTAGDLTITNANVSGTSSLTAMDSLTANSGTNTNFGTLSATGGANGGNITIAETTNMTLGTITNNGTTSTTTLTTTGGAITGKGTGVSDVIASGTGAVSLNASGAATSSISSRVTTGGNVTATATGKNASNDSVYLYGTIGGNLTAQNTGATNTTGDIILGDYSTSRTLNVTGTTSFKTAADLLQYGTLTGQVDGNANRISMWQVGTTNLTLGSITASATGNSTNELFTGYGNVVNIYAAGAIVENGDTSSADITAANGGVTLWAGSGNASAYIQTGVSTGGDAYFWTSGKSGANKSIDIQTGNITGSIVATNDSWGKTTGDISINLTSGNLTTKDVGTAGNVTLTATNGNILQNNAYGFARNITVYSTGNATFQAGDAAGDTTSYIDTGVYSQGDATFMASGKNGSNVSVTAVGRVDGNTYVYDEGTNAVSGDVYLGTSLGSVNLLGDVDTVMDTYGDVLIRAIGSVNLYGGVAVNGKLTITGDTVKIRQDIGGTKIASITTSKTTGTGVDILNYGNEVIQGDGSGVDITTAGTSSILLQAGNAYPADANAYITGLNVSTGGNLTVLVAGDSNGLNSGGTSVSISGTVGGSKNAYDETGSGSPRGSVSMP